MPNLRALPGLIASIVLIAGSLTTAQMKTGEAMENYHEALGLPTDAASVAYRLVLLESNAPGNIFWPDDKPKMTFQIENTDDKPIKTDGHVEVLAFGTQGIAGDIWKPRVVRVGDPIQQIAVKINLPEKGSWQNLTIAPAIPQTRGGYALIVDLGKHGRKLLTTSVRTFAASPKRVRFPSQALDSMKPEVLQRMDIRAIRKGVSFVPPDSDSPHARAKARS
jgi:hypothetical protein